MIFTIREVIDVLVMTAVVGYIFMDLFRLKKKIQRPTFKLKLPSFTFDWQAFKFACMITAPALVLHELAHKFVAISYGLQASFHAAYLWLGLGIIMKLLYLPFVFFVPAYVSIDGGTLTATQTGVIAFAGPAVNLLLTILASWGLKQPRLSRRKFALLFLTKQINLFLFIFNMLPIPYFDGAKVFDALF